MRRLSSCVALLVTVGLLGCHAPPRGDVDSSATESKSGADEKKSKDAKEAKHARAVELAKQKLAHAQLEQRAESAKHDAAIDQAQHELELAQLELSRFDVGEAPLRVRKAELESKQKEDELEEAKEEFEQLKLMYAEQDLADKTRELVVHRQQRRIDLAVKELELKHDELVNLKDAQLAQERGKLALEVTSKQHALEAARLDANVGEDEKNVEYLAAQHALADAEASDEEESGEESNGAGGEE